MNAMLVFRCLDIGSPGETFVQTTVYHSPFLFMNRSDSESIFLESLVKLIGRLRKRFVRSRA